MSEDENISEELVKENIALLELSSQFEPTIAAIEQSHSLSAKNTWSFYTKKPVSQTEWESLVSLAVTPIAEDNPYIDIKPYQEVSAIDSINFKPGSYGLDIRPKIFDNATKSWILVDSGSCVSCVPKKPGDKVDPNFQLKAVNGGKIATYGTEIVSVRLGRKTYEIEAIKADVPHKILGWDLFKKFSLGLEWGLFGDLYLTDNKAGIKSLLKHVTLPATEAVRVESAGMSEDSYQAPNIQSLSSEAIHFQTECMKQLDSFAEVNEISIDVDQPSPYCDESLPLKEDQSEIEKKNRAALKSLNSKYATIIEKFPKLLTTSFKKKPAENIYHRIEVTTDDPCTSKVRPLLANSEKSEKGEKIWKEMEAMGVIERVKPSTRITYSSPLHLVKKPNSNKFRICADFRALNARTKRDNYPIPLLRSFTHKIRGSRYFTKLDMTSAFHHLPIHPDDQAKTCVLSPWGGAFVFKRLAFGLTNGPASWQKYVDSILGDIEGLYCYLDDILLYTQSEEEHIKLVEKVCKRLEEHDLTLALDKCLFGQSKIEYLGYEVSATGICPQRRKVEAIDKIPPPDSQKSLLHFLGALNYFRNCLSGLTKEGVYNNAANLLQPLYSAATVPIPSKDKFAQIWQNSPVLQEAFSDAKKLLKNAAELSHPDPKLPLALWTDASQHSIGAVLMQQNPNGKWTPLGYMSKHLPKEKVNWATYRKELFAVQAGIRYFITEIYGRHCTVYSDHSPLVLAFKNPTFQLHDPVAQRALMEIGQFTQDIRHIAGKTNAGSDFLSRIPPDVKGTLYQDEVASMEGQKLIAMSPAVLHEEQVKCNETESVINGRHPTSVIFQKVPFGEVELVCEMSQSKPRPYLPKSLRTFVIKQLHDALSHDGIKETVRRVSSHYYWLDIKTEVTRYVQTCHGCQSVKPTKLRPPHLGKFEVPDDRFTHCHIDIVGPLPVSNGYKYILTIVDRTTRLLFALPIAEPSAKTCSEQFLLHYVSLCGIPSACTSDQGANFISSLFQEMQKNLGIQMHHTPIYWPQGNGLLERAHQSLKNSIKAQLIEMGEMYQENWYKYLPWALLGRRTAYNKDLGTSSSELTLGTHVQLPGEILQEVTADSEPSINDILAKLQFKNNRAAVPTSTNKQEEVTPPSADVTHVYVKQHKIRGIQPKWIGPFPIKSRPSRSTIEIKVGVNKQGEDRVELRSWSDAKPAYRRESIEDAVRPKRGRPTKSSNVDLDLNTTTNPDVNNNINGISMEWLKSFDFSIPPPQLQPRHWSATQAEIEAINQAISKTNLNRNELDQAKSDQN